MGALNFNLVPVLWVHAVQLILYFVLLLYTWDIRSTPGSRIFMFSLCFAAFWAFCQGMEIAVVSLESKLFFANLQYLGSMMIAALFLLFAISFAKRFNKNLNATLICGLLAVPVIFLLLCFAFPELVRQNVHLLQGKYFSTVGKEYGPLFWCMSLYNYTTTVLAMFTVLKAMQEKTVVIRKQMLLVIIASLFPVIASFLQVTGLNPFKIDLTPMGFSITAVLLTVGIVRFNLFKVIPIARYQVIKVMKAGMIVFDNDGILLDINPAAMNPLKIKETPNGGESIEDVLKASPAMLDIYNSKREQVKEIAFNVNDMNYYYEVSMTCIRTKWRLVAWLFQLYDITERKLAEDIIQHAAYHDSLTGLPNRQYFHLLLTQELTLAKLHGKKLAVAFVDVDNFKYINDTFGHDVGDRVMKAVTRRLRNTLRETDAISRFGGDEFAVFMPGLNTRDSVNKIGIKLVSAFENLIENTGDPKINVKVSVGFSIFPEDGDSIEVLLKKADMAMYAVKGSGKNNYMIYEEQKTDDIDLIE